MTREKERQDQLTSAILVEYNMTNQKSEIQKNDTHIGEGRLGRGEAENRGEAEGKGEGLDARLDVGVDVGKTM
eukprot:13644630-Ditylum_brightwellii.AAC.1